MGWNLAGFGTVERTNAGGGTPRFDAQDVFVLNGAKLLPCTAGLTSPSCTTGGTHTTETESFTRVRFDAAANTWTLWSKNGVRTVFLPPGPPAPPGGGAPGPSAPGGPVAPGGGGGFLDQMNPFNLGGSLAQTGMSIYDSASGMATGDWNRVAGAYGYGPLGQTADAGGFYYYGTRGALVTSGVAAAAAGGLIAAEAAGIGGVGRRPLRAWVRIDRPHHGKGPHLHLGPFEFGPTMPKHVRWPGWKPWFKDLL